MLNFIWMLKVDIFRIENISHLQWLIGISRCSSNGSLECDHDRRKFILGLTPKTKVEDSLIFFFIPFLMFLALNKIVFYFYSSLKESLTPFLILECWPLLGLSLPLFSFLSFFSSLFSFLLYLFFLPDRSFMRQCLITTFPFPPHWLL